MDRLQLRPGRSAQEATAYASPESLHLEHVEYSAEWLAISKYWRRRWESLAGIAQVEARKATTHERQTGWVRRVYLGFVVLERSLITSDAY